MHTTLDALSRGGPSYSLFTELRCWIFLACGYTRSDHMYVQTRHKGNIIIISYPVIKTVIQDVGDQGSVPLSALWIRIHIHLCFFSFYFPQTSSYV